MVESYPNGKRKIARYVQFSPFPTVFSKELYCRHVKTRAWFGKCQDCDRERINHGPEIELDFERKWKNFVKRKKEKIIYDVIRKCTEPLK